MSGVRSAVQAGALAALIMAAVAIAVRVTLWIAPPEREAWTLIGITTDTTALYARLSTSSTGFYDGQVTTRLAALPPQSFVVEHRAMLGPAEGGEDGIVSGSDGLTRSGGSWKLRIGGNNVQVRATSTPSHPPIRECPPETGKLAGVLGVGDGGDASGALLLDGRAVVVHTLAVGEVSNEALYVLGPGFAAGVDPLADCPAWVISGTEEWVGEAPELPEGSEGDVQLGPWTLHIRRLGEPLRMDSHGHLLPIERWAATLVGWREAHQRLQRVTVRMEGPEVNGPRSGVMLRRTVRTQK